MFTLPLSSSLLLRLLLSLTFMLTLTLQEVDPPPDMLSLRLYQDLRTVVAALSGDSSPAPQPPPCPRERSQDDAQGSGASGAAPLRHAVAPGRGLWCENCNSRVVELKRQAVKVWMPFATRRGKITYTVSGRLSFTFTASLSSNMELMGLPKVSNLVPNKQF